MLSSWQVHVYDYDTRDTHAIYCCAQMLECVYRVKHKVSRVLCSETFTRQYLTIFKKRGKIRKTESNETRYTRVLRTRAR